MKKFKSYLKRIFKLISLDEMQYLPGHLAFNIVLMIVPIFSLIGVFGANLDLHQLLISLNNTVPDAVYNLIKSALEVKSGNFNLVFFIIFSLWITSGGCRAMINSSNLLFKVKDNNIVKKYLKSFIMVIVLFLLIGFIIIVPIFGDWIISLLSNLFEEKLMIIITKTYHLLKYPVTIILMFILIKGLYLSSLSIKVKPKYMNNGAFFTTIAWFILTRIYSYHLNNYSNYNLYYGNLANILILLVWVFLMAYIFTIGLALNADNYLTALKNKDQTDE